MSPKIINSRKMSFKTYDKQKFACTMKNYGKVGLRHQSTYNVKPKATSTQYFKML